MNESTNESHLRAIEIITIFYYSFIFYPLSRYLTGGSDDDKLKEERKRTEAERKKNGNNIIKRSFKYMSLVIYPLSVTCLTSGISNVF